MEFQGFHGTDSANEYSILQRNFTVSAKSDEWLGTGAYFFLDGVGNPKDHAESWARLHAYDKRTGTNRYSRLVVISAKIEVDHVLHVDTQEGLEAFNFYREYIKKDIRTKGKSHSDSLLINDCVVFNHILDTTEFQAVINTEYIKLDLWSRLKDYRSRIPNCRVMSIREPLASIDVQGLTVVHKGML